MNRLGVSSACYYPQTTEASFLKACKAGFNCIELFFNSPSELSEAFINNLISVKNEFDIEIPSVHPFMSFAESFFLFSSYERRFFDILDLYRRYFEVMQKIGAEIFIIHGAKIPGSIDDNLYFERFKKLFDIGKSYNVLVCQENVVNYRSESIDFLVNMKKCLGDDFSMVLDIKQARRAAQKPDDFICRFGNSIKHIHISDFNEASTCIPPLEGEFDFIAFFNNLKNINYNGKFIIELYNHSYTNESQISDSFRKINELLIDY